MQWENWRQGSLVFYGRVGGPLVLSLFRQTESWKGDGVEQTPEEKWEHWDPAMWGILSGNTQTYQPKLFHTYILCPTKHCIKCPWRVSFLCVTAELGLLFCEQLESDRSLQWREIIDCIWRHCVFTSSRCPEMKPRYQRCHLVRNGAIACAVRIRGWNHSNNQSRSTNRSLVSAVNHGVSPHL